MCCQIERRNGVGQFDDRAIRSVSVEGKMATTWQIRQEKKTKGIMAVVLLGEHQGITLKLKLKENGRRNELLSNASVLEVAWHKLR